MTKKTNGSAATKKIESIRKKYKQIEVECEAVENDDKQHTDNDYYLAANLVSLATDI